VGGLRLLVTDAQQVVVVSPHLDDAVLSLGASIASWSRAGVAVEILTVLGCDPESEAPAGGWDRRGGFATERESALARREEDRRACALLGAAPMWLPFGSVDYERHGDVNEVRQAVADAVGKADLVLLPGYPLSHPDHEWVARSLVSDSTATRFALYAEQPYARRAGVAPEVPQWLAVATAAVAFEAAQTQLRDRLAKWRAIGAYGSQLPLLGMRRSLGNGVHRYALGPEWIAPRAEGH
jgi:LmbE family N-acetylglucosaminyl deacetylase